MAICVLFLYPIEEHTLSLSIDNEGNIIAPLLKRSADELKQLTKTQDQIIGILPTFLASFHQVTLPWIADQKARTALPFALEDEISEPLENVHLAFSKEYYLMDVIG